MKALGILVAILVILGGIGAYVLSQSTQSVEPVRVEGWAEGSDDATNITFQYPEKLSETYITVNDWPPSVQKKPGTLICKEGEQDQGLIEKSVKRTINGREYCIISTEEAAAGSLYGQYLYRGRRDDGIVTVIFTLRYPQCANYPDDKKAECEAERSSFDLDQLVDKIVMSVGDRE